jgi:hypothetical protein
MQISGGLIYPLALLTIVLAVAIFAAVLTWHKGMSVRAIFREFTLARSLGLIGGFSILILSFGVNGRNLRATYWQALLYLFVSSAPVLTAAIFYIMLFRRRFPQYLEGDREGAPRMVVWAANLALIAGLVVGAIIGEPFRR